jgi:PAS domain S-box-containing protein
MVHVEKFNVKGNTYYKLVHSIRQGGKVKSKSKYLGKIIPAPTVLSKLKKEFYAKVTKDRLSNAGTINSGPIKQKIQTIQEIKNTQEKNTQEKNTQEKNTQEKNTQEKKPQQVLSNSPSKNPDSIKNPDSTKVHPSAEVAGSENMLKSSGNISGINSSETLGKTSATQFVHEGLKETDKKPDKVIEGDKLDAATTAGMGAANANGNVAGNVDGNANGSADKGSEDKSKDSKSRKVRITEEFYHHVFEKNLDPLFVFDVEDMKLIDFNMSAQLLSGYPADELFEMTFNQLLSTSSRKKINSIISEFIFNKRNQLCQLTLVAKNKKEFPIEGTIAIMSDTGGDFLVGNFRNISMRKRAENLAKSTSIFKAMSESISEVVFRADPTSYAPSYVNGAVKSIFGYTVEEWLGISNIWKKSTYPEDLPKLMGALDIARKNKTAIDISFRIITKSNDIRWVLAHLGWEMNRAGKIISLLGVIQDVTEGKGTADKFRILFNDSPVAMLEHDYSLVKQYLDLHKLTSERDVFEYFEKNPNEIKNVEKLVRVETINEAALNLFQYDAEIFVRDYAEKQLFRSSDSDFIHELGAIAEEKATFETEIKILPKTGKPIDSKYLWSVPHAYRSTYKKVLVSILDLSMQRKAAEAMITKNYAIESSSSGILITDLEGNVSYANSRVYELLGLPEAQEVIGLPVTGILSLKKKSMHTLRNLKPDQSWDETIIIGQKNPTYLDSHASYIIDDFGKKLGVVFSFLDITELKKTENIRLEFTNIAAHELKTPLTPIRTLLSLMHDDPSNYGINAEGTAQLEVCLRNVNRLNVLIGDILDISRIEAGGMKFLMRKFDLLAVLKNTVRDYSETIKKKNLTLRTKLPKSLPLLFGDSQRISQVVGNLLKNASNFTKSGSIMVTASIKSGDVQVEIIDTGAGISKAGQEKLFTKFYQEQDITTRSTKGSGLGLAISKGIIEHHKGKIWAFSQGKGTGTTFTFTLPLKKPKISEVPQKNIRTLKEEKELLQETNNNLEQSN